MTNDGFQTRRHSWLIMAIRRTLWNALTAAIATTSPKNILQEIKLACSDGTTLAAQLWRNSSAPNVNSGAPPRTVLCLHGWMDNCRSFHRLAPAIAASPDGRFQVVALDLPGHGRSSHKSLDAPPMVHSEMVYYVSEAVDAMERQGLTTSDRVTLVGHSLGAGISSLFAASFPEQVDQLVLLDGAGFLARNAKDTPLHVRHHIRRRKLVQSKKQKPDQDSRGYPSLEAAISRRLQSVKSMPGNQTLSYEAAKELVLRATHLDGDDTHKENSMDPIRFRHDSRFAWPSIQYMTQEQNEGIFAALGGNGGDGDESTHRIDCCILLANEGWPFRQDHMDRSLALIQPRVLRTLPGSHFFHADPETSDEVATAVVEFLSSTPNDAKEPLQ